MDLPWLGVDICLAGSDLRPSRCAHKESVPTATSRGYPAYRIVGIYPCRLTGSKSDKR